MATTSSLDIARQNTASTVALILRVYDRNVEDAAPIMGISKSALYNKLKAAAPFRAEELVCLADWLGIDPEVFLRSPEMVLNRLREQGKHNPVWESVLVAA